ncbi:peptidoglycan DD-metalloendopeptidase family protein [Patescibacteria group bacterium]|nr:peptidoglycan DD-metalloendopeptidase family protein [Patescibacteria group bacterium]
MPSKKYKIISFLVLLAIGYWLLAIPVDASRVDELKFLIEDRNSQMAEIQKEINEYKQQLDQVSEQKDTLNNEIKKLELNLKKFNSDIYYTNKQVEATTYNIERLELEIDDKSESIKDRKIVLSETMRSINEIESQSLAEITLSSDKFSDFFGDLERMESFQNQINVNLQELKDLKEILENEKIERESEKKSLEGLKSKLVDQKTLVESNKSTKNTLLKETKNKEENYKKLLADRLAKQKALEDEIRDIELQISIEIDPNSLPPSVSGILKWPFDQVVITQYFGNTPFATQNPQVYNGMGHNGIDFRASIGTPIKSSNSGVIIGIGDTDKQCGGVSYGKWVLIEHPNNLSTLYAHLSLIKVSNGQQIETGQIIGYSGNTGYTTGPHLHFAVFASQGVKVDQIKSKVCGTMLTLPVASRSSYLNPLSYLGD